ncbi:hypothetical protein [Hubei permutotetra-like virus 5]|uniref:hypothetical protein n=1 Tax=Hubei permutotetra-like virus 5 TaxID=1923079 RepID=UPI0009096C5F|nr:hypothetical protein [Hubei permutotetra-like virus 5]APG76968.1 hypothetical protein [Hubei permutotetra-like virus 5]
MKCNVCDRNFKTVQDCAKHTAMVHPTKKPGKTTKRTNRRNRNRRLGAVNNQLGKQTSVGHDLIGIYPVKKDMKPGTIVAYHVLSPQHMVPSRLNTEAALFSRWKPLSLKVTVTNSGAFTTFGALTVAWCPDPTISHRAENSVQLARISSFRPSKVVRLNNSVVLNIPTEMPTKWYHCDGIPELTSHGTLVIMVSAQTGGFDGFLSSTVHLEWRVQFEGIEMPAVIDAAEILRPDPGWNPPFFTTSDGGYDGSRLILKEHPGGDMVFFSAGRYDTIYGPADGEPPIYAHLENGSSTEVKHFAIVQNYVHKGLACFNSLEEARSYVLTGSPDKIMRYIKAGDYSNISKFKIIEVPKSVTQIQAEIDKLQQQIEDQVFLDCPAL